MWWEEQRSVCGWTAHDLPAPYLRFAQKKALVTRFCPTTGTGFSNMHVGVEWGRQKDTPSLLFQILDARVDEISSWCARICSFAVWRDTTQTYLPRVITRTTSSSSAVNPLDEHYENGTTHGRQGGNRVRDQVSQFAGLATLGSAVD